MRAMDSMLEKLIPLDLYHLEEGSLVRAELLSMAKGLDIVYEALECLEQEAFVATASGFGLEMREQAFGAKRAETPLATRREMLLRRGAVTLNDCTKESIEQALLGVGLRALVQEMPGRQQLHINCVEVLDHTARRSDLVRAAERYLPAHLELDFDFGKVTWAYLEGTGKSFAELEALEYTWDEIRRVEENTTA